MDGCHLYKRLILLAGVCGFVTIAQSTFVNAMPLDTHRNVLETEQSLSSHYLVEIAGDTQLTSGALKFVQSMADRGIGFLGNGNMSETEKRNAFRVLLKDSFDMKTIGRFSLGRYWRTATPEQRSKYQKLFERMVIDVYSTRFSEYKGQKFEARSVRQEGTKDAIVTSFIIPETGPEIQVDWRVRHKGGSYQVVDVIVEGVSMSVTQRSDFSSVIQRGGGSVQVLIDHLASL